MIHNWALTLILILISAIIIFMFYRLRRAKQFSFLAHESGIQISLVIICKNNQKLLEHIAKTLIKTGDDFNQIILLDMGSIDETIEVASNLLPKDKTTILNISAKIISENYMKIIGRYATGELALIWDLNRISMKNPNYYIPNLIIPLDTVRKTRYLQPDPRIDGCKLLYLDSFEKRKNAHLFHEHIMVTMSNIRMRIEAYQENIFTQTGEWEEQAKDLLQYIDLSSNKLVILSALIGSRTFSGETLHENILRIVKEFTYSHNVSINYRLLGQPKVFKQPINDLILAVTQDILFSIIQCNLTNAIDIYTKYNRKKFQMFFKYENKGEELLKADNDLNYYVLTSIQNRLNLLGGCIRIHSKREKTVISIWLPIDQSTCQYEAGDEK